MTAKDKAEELLKIYILVCNNWSSNFIEFKNIKDLKNELIRNEWFIPKQCALIAVNEILKAVESDWSFMEVKQEFWKKVKQEIELL